jgi:hypothetical protein
MVRKRKGRGHMDIPPPGVVRNLAPILTNELISPMGPEMLLTAIDALLKIILKGFTMRIIYAVL